MSIRSSSGPETLRYSAESLAAYTGTFVRLVVEVAAGTGIHLRRRQHKPCRKAQRHACPRNRYLAIFKWLAHYLENVAGKLRQLVKKKALRYWPAKPRPGAGIAPPPINPASEIVWWGARNGRCVTSPASASSTPATEWILVGSFSLIEAQAAPGSTAASWPASSCLGARRPDHQDVVAPCRGDFERPLCSLLAAHVFEIQMEALQARPTASRFRPERAGS